MLSIKINDLETKIKELDSINGFKKSINQHNVIHKELEQCRNSIVEMEKFIDGLSEIYEKETDGQIVQNNPDGQISDEQYTEYLSEITALNDIFGGLDIDEAIQVYQNVMEKIKLCDNYLKSRKMEITYLDKK